MDMLAVQSLSTQQLSAAQSTDPTLDILTGFHMVDGCERIIVVEGLAGGAMEGLVSQVAAWALEEPQPEPGWVRRHVLFNRAIRCGAGVGVWDDACGRHLCLQTCSLGVYAAIFCFLTSFPV